MKVLMLSWEYTPNVVGGLGKHVIELVPELISCGVEVHLVTPRFAGGEPEEPLLLPDGSPATNGSLVHRVEPTDIGGDFFANTWHDNIDVEEFATRLVRSEGNFDLVHNHDWLTGFAGIALKRNFHLPLLTTIHATEMGRDNGNLWSDMQRSIHQAEWWLTYEAWRIIACSHYMAWEIEHYFAVPPDKIDVIPNGVDAARFDALKGADLTAFRAQFARPDEPIIYYVGRMVHEKGLWGLLDAVPLVLREFPGARFVLAGGGDYVNELRAKAHALRIENSIIFPGRIPDEVRDSLFMVADCAVFPSLYEPFGIVALEAMAAGTPVVVADAGGLSEVVDLHETGIKVRPNDSASLAWGIIHTLRHPEWSRIRAANAQRVAREQYTWRRVAASTVAVYEWIVREAKAGDWAYRND